MAGPRSKKSRTPRSKKAAPPTEALSDQQRAALSKRLSQMIPTEPLTDQRAAATRLTRAGPRKPPRSIQPSLPADITQRIYIELWRLAPASPDTEPKDGSAPVVPSAPSTPAKNIPYK